MGVSSSRGQTSKALVGHPPVVGLTVVTVTKAQRQPSADSASDVLSWRARAHADIVGLPALYTSWGAPRKITIVPTLRSSIKAPPAPTADLDRSKRHRKIGKWRGLKAPGILLSPLCRALESSIPPSMLPFG